MTDRHKTLRVIRVRGAGESASLALCAAADCAHDPVLVIGAARDARVASQILGRPVRCAPEPRVGGGRALERVVARVAHATGSGAIERMGFAEGDLPALGEHAARHLPSRLETRRALGLTDELVIAPLSDRPASVDARTLMFIAGVIGIIGERIAIALPSRARRLNEALNYHRSAGLGAPCRIIEGAWLHALPAADVLVEPADRGPVADSLLALARGLGASVAATEAWHLDPDAATNSLPAEIHATVGKVLRETRARRAQQDREGSPAPAPQASHASATVSA